MKAPATFFALMATLVTLTSASAASADNATNKWNDEVRTLILKKIGYPSSAISTRLEGEVKLRVKIAERRVIGVELLKTSGSDRLDRHAIKSVLDIRTPSLPESIESKSLVVPLRYEVIEKPSADSIF